MRLPGSSSLVTWNKSPMTSQTYWRVSFLFWTKLWQKAQNPALAGTGAKGESAVGRGGSLEMVVEASCIKWGGEAPAAPTINRRFFLLSEVTAETSCFCLPPQCWCCGQDALRSVLGSPSALCPAVGWPGNVSLPSWQRVLVAGRAIYIAPTHRVSALVLLC